MKKAQQKKLPQLSTQASEAVKKIVQVECGEFSKVQSVVNGAILVFRDAPLAKKRAAVREANRLLEEQLAALGRAGAQKSASSFQPRGAKDTPSRMTEGTG